MTWSRGWSGGDRHPKPEETKPTWIPVINPEPVYDSPEQKRRYEDAVARVTRQPGEDVVAWIERVGDEARAPAPLSQGRLPYRDPDTEREPGMEG